MDEESSRKQRPILKFVNGIWVDHRFPLNPSFLAIAKDVYRAQAKNVDFQSQGEQVRKELNLWVENETKGLLKGLLPTKEFKDSKALVMANALYLKGEWSRPFYISDTRHEVFDLLSGATVKVPFMTSFGEEHCYASFEGVQTLKLPYKSSQDSEQFSIYVFLPSKKDGLPKLMEQFNSDTTLLHKHLKNIQQVELSKMWIPKFKFSYGFQASDTLKKLGLTLPFEPVGDLTEMAESSKDDEVHVSSMFHTSVIEVNEFGTEAAAYTSEEEDMSCSLHYRPPPPRPSFVADHPFMFMIKEDISGIVFFIGAVLNPLDCDESSVC